MDNSIFKDSFYFTRFVYKNVKRVNNENGIECHFIGRIIRGSGIIRSISGDEMRLASGDVFYLPRGLKYCSLWMPDDSGEVSFDSFRFTLLAEATSKKFVMQRLSLSEREAVLIDSIAQSPAVNSSSIGLLYSLLGSVIGRLVPDTDSSRDRLMFERAQQYVEEHPNFKAPELARHLCICESSLYAFFKRYAKTTPTELKNKIALKRAKSLLCSTDLSVEDICEAVGFQSIAHFRRIFRETFGKTPCEVRREEAGKLL